MNAVKQRDSVQPVINFLYAGCAELEVIRRITDDIYDDIQGEQVDLPALARLASGLGYLLNNIQERMGEAISDLEEVELDVGGGRA